MGGFSTAFGAGFAHDPAPTPAPTQPTDEAAPPAPTAGVPRLVDFQLLRTGARVLTKARKVGALPLYQELVCRCGDKGLCWPNQETLCADLGVSEWTIRRRVAELVEVGLVTVRRRRNKSQLYRLTRLAGWEPISLVDKPVDDAADDTPEENRTGQQGARSRTGQQGARSGPGNKVRAQNPSLNPPLGKPSDPEPEVVSHPLPKPTPDPVPDPAPEVGNGGESLSALVAEALVGRQNGTPAIPDAPVPSPPAPEVDHGPPPERWGPMMALECWTDAERREMQSDAEGLGGERAYELWKSRANHRKAPV